MKKIKQYKIYAVGALILTVATVIIIILYFNTETPHVNNCKGTMAVSGFEPNIDDVGSYEGIYIIQPNHSCYIDFSTDPTGGCTYCIYVGTTTLHRFDDVVCNGFSGPTPTVIKQE